MKNNKGITLIALIITIIVMLILVGVTISTAVNGGLFKNAGEAAGKTKNELKNEQNLANSGIEVDGIWYSSIDDYISKKLSKSIKFTVKVISTNNECLKTIEYTTNKDMTWEMFAKTSNNSDEYYKLATYTGGRVDVVLEVDGVERYGLRATEEVGGYTIRRDDIIEDNKVYYAKAFSLGW